jgi:ATP-dependent Clp protease ATP-binding subunit ClpA
MFERYTEKARRVIFFARYEASQFGSPCIDTEHLLLGMIREDAAIVKRMSRLPFKIESIRKRIEELVSPREKVSTSVDLPLSAACKRVLAFAVEEAERLGDKHIDSNHLLLGLMRERDGLAARVLTEAGINTSEFREEVARMSDASWRVAQPQKTQLQDYVEIHGESWGANSVRELGEYYARFDWEKRRWLSRDALVRRADQKLRLYAGQSYDPEQFDLVKGGWNEDRCAICTWKLCESDSAEHSEGYTNGQDWLCTECHGRFVSPKRLGDL